MSIRLYLTIALVFVGLITSNAQTIETVVGSDPEYLPAASANVNPNAVSEDANGVLYFTDNQVLWRLDAAQNLLVRVAGTKRNEEFFGDGGPAGEVSGASAIDMEIDDAGNIYLAQGNVVRKIDVRTGLIYPVAGNVHGGYEKEGVLAIYSDLNVEGITLDDQGNLYIAAGTRLRKVNLETGVITTIAGTGEFGSGGKGDGGPALAARFSLIQDVALDSERNIYVADARDNRIRRIDAETGLITTIIGGKIGFEGDGGPAIEAEINFEGPNQIRLNIDQDALYFNDQYTLSSIRKINLNTGILTTVVGGGNKLGDPTTPSLPPFTQIRNFFINQNNELIFTAGNAVLKLEHQQLTTVTGRLFNEEWEDVKAKDALLDRPRKLDFDSRGNLYFISSGLLLRKDAQSGIVSSLDRIGIGTGGNIVLSRDIVLSGDSLIYFTSRYTAGIYAYNLKTEQIFEVVPDQDLGRTLGGIDLDEDGHIYFASVNERRIRKINLATGELSTLNLDRSTGSHLAVGNDGFIYFDGFGNRIYKADLRTGTTTRLGGFYSDGIQSISIDDRNNKLFVISKNRVYEIDLVSNSSDILSGSDNAGFSGDGGPAQNAILNRPLDLAVDNLGNVYIADNNNNRIRRINMPGGDRPMALSAQGSFWSEQGTYRPIAWKRGRVQFEIEVNEEGRGTVKVAFEKVPMYFRKSRITSFEQFGELFIIKGEGTINNEGMYTFLIRYARDTNKVRIVITDENDEIVYDNQFGKAISAEPEVLVSSYDDFPGPTDILTSSADGDLTVDIDNEVIIYPNPTSDVMAVFIPDYRDSAEVRMEITDLSGKILFTQLLPSGKESEISMGSLKSGIYLIKLDLPGESKTYQVVKE